MRLRKAGPGGLQTEPATEAAWTHDRVRVLFCDQLNLARGKYMPKAHAAKGAARFCLGAFAVTYQRDLLPVPHGGLALGLPDIEATFDPGDLRPSWEPNTQIALADLVLNGAPAPLDGRGALKRAIAAWRDLGLEPMVGLEGEAFIFQRDAAGAWVPYDTPGAYVYGTGPFTDPAGLIDEIWETAFACGLPVESINSEYDWPQFELTLHYADALKACDDFFLFRTMAREILFRRGYLLSFLPKPLADRGGSGLHVNLSFIDGKGRNALAAPMKKGALTEPARGCVAGLVHHHEALTGLLAPLTNSYDRLQPASLCGYWANWGFDHRGVAVRISAETGAGGRIEHRLGDCAASPYVAVAAVLNAARLGFTRKYDLPPAETGDGVETVDTNRHAPTSLPAALDALMADEALVDAVGRPLIENYEGVKRAELGEVGGKTAQDTFEYYAPFI